MAPVGAAETQLERVLDGVGLRLPAEADESDAVVHALCAVFVSDIEDDRVLPDVEEKPAGKGAPR